MIFKHICSITLILHVFFVTNAYAVITCSTPKEECIEGKGETRNIENIPIAPGCWKYRVTYECREEADNNCKRLRDRGCTQINAKCKTILNGTCVVQDEIYNCPVKKCETNEISCGKDIFCASGDCVATNPIKTKEEDLGKAIAGLSALFEAAKDVKEQNTRNPTIFAGKAMECSRNILPGITKDCCANNERLFNCAEDEKELYQMKKAGRAIELGEYCHNERLGICTSYHKVYCVFGSRLARIIQNNGRKVQLRIGFGEVGDDYARPNCRGITKDELSKMKFDQMDFSELYAEIKNSAEVRKPKAEAFKQKSDTPNELKEKSTKNLGISESSETSAGLKAAERIRDFYDERVKK